MRAWLALATLALGCAACEDGAVAPADASRPAPDAQPVPPTAVDGGQLIFVAPDRTLDGDGTRSRPLGSLVEAYARLQPGDTVLLLAGDHGEVPPPPAGTRLVGEGAHATRIEGDLRLDAGQTLEALSVHGPLELGGEAALVGVSLTQAPAPIARIVGAARWTDVDVTAVSGAGPAVTVAAQSQLTWRGGGARALAGGVVANDGGVVALAGLDFAAFDGVGVASAGGQLQLDDVRMHEPLGAGVLVTGGAATLRRVDIFDPQLDLQVNTASGVGVTGGEVTVERSYVRGGDRAFRVALEGSLQVVDCVSDASGADGLGVSAGAQGQVAGLRVIRPRNAGVAVSGDGALLGLAGAVVERPGRIGLLVSDGAQANVDGLEVTDALNRGVSVIAAGASLRGLQVSGAQDVGVQITDATAPVLLEASEVRGCGTSGVAASGRMPEGLTLRDVTVSGTYDAGFELAIGVHLYQSGATIERLTAHDNQGPGVQVEQSGARLTDATLTDNGAPGAVVLEGVGTVVLEGLTAERNGGAGVLAVRSEVELVRPTLVANRAVAAEGPGDGASAFVQADLRVVGGLSLENEGSGVAASVGSGLALAEGVRLEGNQRYGVEVACDGSRLDPPEDADYAGNRLGDRNPCP